MTDTKDLIREIQEHTAAHGGENTATHLLVQAVMELQRQADEMAAIGAGGVSGPLLGGTLRTQAQPAGDDAEAAARRSFPQWWSDMGASLCGVDPLASSPPQTYAARGFMGGYVAALAAPQQAAPADPHGIKAFADYLAECEDCSIVPDVAGAFNAGRNSVNAAKAAPQQEVQYDHGPQAEAVAEAARDVGKWLNERPNRPLDLRHVAMLAHHATAQPAPSGDAWKDGDTAALVNQLRDVAIEYRDTQQLRERISHIVRPLAARAAPSGDAELPPSYLGSVLSSSLHGNSVALQFGDRDEAIRWHDAVADAWDAARKEGK
jgi:hypothetical protein